MKLTTPCSAIAAAHLPWKAAVSAAIIAVAASATIPMAASAATQIVTNTVDGISWQLLIHILDC